MHTRAHTHTHTLCFAGADIRSVCTEAGMFAIRARRKVIKKQNSHYVVDTLFSELKTRPLFIYVPRTKVCERPIALLEVIP